MIASLLFEAISAAAASDKITIDDIEARFRNMQSGATDAVKGNLGGPKIGGAVGGVVLVLLLIYFLGRRRGRKRATVLEIRRIV